ncbi:MAG: GNAT family N-acetyltransferase [Pseudomonadota bacterium]
MTLRPARKSDAEDLVQLINIAGEGLPLFIWEMMREEGEEVWDTGRRRARRSQGSFSYTNATLGMVDGDVVALMMGYPLPDVPTPIDYEGMPPLFVPLQELENLVPGSWYINVMATYAPHRNRGFGLRLLKEAERIARTGHCPMLSIITSDSNPALRLYQRFGFEEVTRRAIEKGGWEYHGSEWVLLSKSL